MTQKKIDYLIPVADAQLPARQSSEIEWERLTAKQRSVATERLQLISLIMQHIDRGVKMRAAVENFVTRIKIGNAPTNVLSLAKKHAKRGGEFVSDKTLARWIKLFREGGKLALAPNHKGSVAKTRQWESRALYWLRSGANLNPGNIANVLQQEDFDVTYHQVLAWYKRLPGHVQNNRSRLGNLKYESTQLPYVRRSLENIAPGEYWQIDGNMGSVFVSDAVGKSLQRAEFTLEIDVASRYLVGYAISKAESGNSTLQAITRGILTHKHVPLEIQSDNGPGFNNARVQTYLSKLGIQPFYSRPGNPKDNGYIERFNRTIKNELFKRLPGYCGRDASPDFIKATRTRYQKDRSSLLSIKQFEDALIEYIAFYNEKRIHSAHGKTPAEIWSMRKPNPPVDLEDAYNWDEATRTVRQASFSIETFEYHAAELMAWNNKKVLVEYNPFDSSYVKVRTIDGRWICDAKMILARDYRHKTIRDKQIANSEKQKIGRARQRLDDTVARSRLLIDHTSTLDAISKLAAENLSGIEEETSVAATTLVDKKSDITLDIFNTDYTRRNRD